MYLNTTNDFNLITNSMSPSVLSRYTDADWARDSYTRSSTSAHVFLIGNNPISWFSERQKFIALSSCKSEYIAAPQAAQEIQWLILPLKDLRQEKNQSINCSRT
ncbi:hypothetical protein NPIL_13731 [Nephila pilipes]|uniref:Uncharacterized protein n=1 Tax=Nephila pilipes TaxID=299642 RepID=A0A8X6NAW3_NEPPI|nr:hypothetical protein NPIL_13731 [Nephila pilipes]